MNSLKAVIYNTFYALLSLLVGFLAYCMDKKGLGK
ncbi:hypothetical protein IIM_02144 [Bacillus cereus VD107]|nr:hypothetical protein IIM_02144 [Bacillus cereus VD107]